MSVPAYPVYRDSGVTWIGCVPASWSVLPFKRVAQLITERATDRSFPVGLEHIESWSGRLHEAEAEFEGDGTAFQQGDILFGKLRPYLAKAWLADRAGEAVGDFHVIRARAPHEAEFLQRLLLSREVISLIDGSTYGAKMPRASWEFIGSLPVPIPTHAEQCAIATFLDGECGKIDALVAEQEQLISLLKEKRQAVISHAMTKGLDPNRPTKDSGAEWLGEVPAHWDVVPLMRLTQVDRPIMYGIVLPGPDVGEGIPILKGGNVRPSRLNLHSMARTTPEIEAPYARARLREGDLVYSIRGSIGDCEIVPPELAGSNITQDVARVAPRDGINPEWLRFALLSDPVREALASGSLGAAVRGINIFDLKRARIPVPPPEERAAIADYVRATLSGIESLSAEAEHAVALLKERRAALISAAVTGKIDVRGLVAPEEAKAA